MVRILSLLLLLNAAVFFSFGQNIVRPGKGINDILLGVTSKDLSKHLAINEYTKFSGNTISLYFEIFNYIPGNWASVKAGVDTLYASKPEILNAVVNSCYFKNDTLKAISLSIRSVAKKDLIISGQSAIPYRQKDVSSQSNYTPVYYNLHKTHVAFCDYKAGLSYVFKDKKLVLIEVFSPFIKNASKTPPD